MAADSAPFSVDAPAAFAAAAPVAHNDAASRALREVRAPLSLRARLAPEPPTAMTRRAAAR